MWGKGTTGEAEKKVTGVTLSVSGERNGGAQKRWRGLGGTWWREKGYLAQGGGVKDEKAGNAKRPTQHILFPSLEKRGGPQERGGRQTRALL